MTAVFVEQPLALPMSAKKKDSHITKLCDEIKLKKIERTNHLNIWQKSVTHRNTQKQTYKRTLTGKIAIKMVLGAQKLHV